MTDRASLRFGARIPAARTFLATTATLLVSLLCLSGCKANHDNDKFGSSVTPMDHDPSDTFVRTVYIDGRWVGSAVDGGQIVADGISLPSKWHPGLTAVVEWERCDRFDRNHPVPDEIACRWTKKVVPITKYDEVGHTDVHIMEGDKVLIIPTMLDPSHPDYPGPNYPTKNFHQKAFEDYRKEHPNG